MPIRVAVDVMGGDLGPAPAVEGAVAAARAGGVHVLLVGDEPTVRTALEANAAPGTEADGGALVEVRHAPDVVGMGESPSKAVRQKPNSSIAVAFGALAAGDVGAVVSAGNTGAVMAFALRLAGRLPGVERPAIATVVPTKKGESLMLDMGANVDCHAAHLVQFALMGAAYARAIQEKPRPRIALLSNGSEQSKGNEVTRQAQKILQQLDLDYVGYVEGREIFGGDVDVIVQDGFVGNVVLKTIEGAAEAIGWMIRSEIERSFVARAAALALGPVFRRFRDRLDYSEYGGAPLLGTGGATIICHGQSSAKAFENAVSVAARIAQSGLNDALVSALKRFEHQLPDGSRARNHGSRAEVSR